MISEPPVTIVGAGIAGLSVAIALRHRGIEVEVLEQASELREIGAGLLLGPNACAVLQRLNVLQNLQNDRSVTVPCWEVRDKAGKIMSALNLPTPGETSISTTRSDLQDVLSKQLPRDVIKFNHTITDAEMTTDGVQLHLADGRQRTAKKVIIADGVHSKARAAFWPNSQPRYCGYMGWRGLVNHVPAGWEIGRVCESWGLGRRFGIAPVGRGRTYW